MKSSTKILVFGASSSKIAKTFADDAYLLGQLIARKGWVCVNGAGRDGLMRAVSDGVLDNGGEAIGVIPQFMIDNKWNYERLTSTIATADMHQRKEKMADLADAIVALPGGCGTWEELFEAFTWRQLNIMPKPIVLLNTGGYYNPIVNMIKRSIDEGFMKPSHAKLLTVAKTPQEAIAAIEEEFEHGVTHAESKY